MISNGALIEFKAILFRDHGLQVDDKTALKIANDFLISLEAILIKPERKVDKSKGKEGK